MQPMYRSWLSPLSLADSFVRLWERYQLAESYRNRGGVAGYHRCQGIRLWDAWSRDSYYDSFQSKKYTGMEKRHPDYPGFGRRSYSAHLYIPIRSQQNPIMNENNPGSSVQATIDYLERKQYGSMSMTMRMFERRAEWTNQFGTHRHMGFWGYFNEQYGVNGTMFIPLFLVGLFGVWGSYRKRPSIGVPFLLVIILSSIGLILYMNFADGTRIDPVTGRDYLEVRDRDYFFTSAFIFFGLAIGIGLTFIVNAVREWISKNASGVKNIGTVGMFVLYLLPVYAVAHNYDITKRTNNYMPYDYGWNLLASADKNAIFIYGRRQ